MLIWLLVLAMQNHSESDIVSVSLSSFSGGALATECAKDRGLQMDACTSYILGVADTLQLQGITCRPLSDAATLQTVTIARRYINEHPENWGWHPIFLVKTPLVKAFPCPRR